MVLSPPLERETLLANVFGMKIFFQRLGCSQALEDAFLLIRRVARGSAHRFESRLDPAFLGDIGRYMYSEPIELQYVCRTVSRISRSEA